MLKGKVVKFLTYKCRCITNEGKIIRQNFEANNMEELHHILHSKNLRLVEVSRTNDLLNKVRDIFKKKLTLKELGDFCSQMTFILDSNTYLLHGLNIIRSNKENNRTLSHVISTLYKDVQGGQSLSHSMMTMGNIVPPLLIYMVSSGEISGQLPQSFSEMEKYYKKQHEIKQKIKTAMIQPIVLLILCIVLMVFFLKMVLPDLMSSIEISEESLPAITKAVMNLSDFISAYYLLIIVGTGLLIYGLKTLFKIPKVKYIMHGFYLKLPVIGKNIKSIETHKFSTTLNLLLKSGITMVESLDTIVNILSNERAKESVAEAKKELLKGNTFYQGLMKQPFFDEMFLKSVNIGEETGYIEETLAKMSIQYDSIVRENMTKTLALLEPVLTVGIGIFVGIFILAIALPIFSMASFTQQ